MGSRFPFNVDLGPQYWGWPQSSPHFSSTTLHRSAFEYPRQNCYPAIFFSFFSPSVFISKSNMGHENMCMHKEYKPYDCSSAGGRGGGRAGGGGGGEGEDTKCWERTRAEETVSCFILLTARLKQHFLSRDTVVLLKQSESLSLFSSPSSHDLTYRNRDEPEHEAAHFGLFIFLLSLFSPPHLPFFFWYISSCRLQMPHKPTSLYWKHYWREFGWITAALCMSETSEGLSLSRFAFTWRQS